MIAYLNEDEFWIKLNSEKINLIQPMKLYSMSSLGRLLEDLVFTSKSLKDCLKNFGSEADSDMLNFMILQIPLVGGTIFTALEFYGMGKIIQSDNISEEVKSSEIFKTVTKVSMSIGSAVTGGIFGQILIPVPVVGALVGSFLGGAIGTLFGKAIDGIKTHDPIKFTLLVEFLIKVRDDNGNWSFDFMNGVIKDVIARWYTLSKPKEIDNEELWLTVICFVCVSLYFTVVKTWLKGGKRVEKETKKYARDGNNFMENSIFYLAQRINLLKFDKELIKVNEVLGILIKEEFIEFDLHEKVEDEILIPDEGKIGEMRATKINTVMLKKG